MDRILGLRCVGYYMRTKPVVSNLHHHDDDEYSILFYPSLFITLVLYQQENKVFRLGQARRYSVTLQEFHRKCAFFHSAYLNSICCHLHKNSWMESQTLHQDSVEYRQHIHTLCGLCVCVCLPRALHICLLTCE